MKKPILIFFSGVCTTLVLILVAMLVIYPNYSDYRKEAEISYMLAFFKANIKEIESQKFNKHADQFKIIISKDNWVYFQSYRSHQTLLLIPVKTPYKIEWQCYASSTKLKGCL